MLGALGWLGVLCALASAAEIKLPLIDGELGGIVSALKLPGAPELHWKIGLTRSGGAGREADVAIDGAGTAIRAHVRLDAAGELSWRLDSARLDLAVWSPVLASQIGPEWAQAALQGIVTAAGDGTWRRGGWGGRGRIALTEVRVEDPARKVLFEGIAAELVFDDLAARRTPARQTLRWRAGHFDTIALGAGELFFSIDGEQVTVEQASTKIWGGEVNLAAFGFSLRKMEMSLDARVVGIEVAALLPLLPPVLAEAEGRLDGSFTLRRDSSGFQIGAGRLALQGGQPAELKLAPTPGLLSGSLPPAVLKYYPGLGKIETGEIPLRASLLEVAFTPEGDAEGRTASIHLAGGPVDPKLRAPIDLTINVRGPLESLVKFGTSSKLRFGDGR